MASDLRFAICLKAKPFIGPLQSWRLSSAQLFDETFVAENAKESLNCQTPWKYPSLMEFIEAKSGLDRSKINLVQLDVVDLLSTERRRVCEQRWASHSILVDWTVSPFSEPVCIVALELRESSGAASQLVKVRLSPSDYSIFGHAILFGKDPVFPDEVKHIDGYSSPMPGSSVR